MTSGAPISLRFSPDISSVVRSRISYAFRVFAAIYDHRVVEVNSGADSICFVYGEPPAADRGSRSFFIPARYRLRAPEATQQKLLKHRYANEDHYLVYGKDEATGNPDWLGEIFEWISSSFELNVVPRDSAERIAFSDMIFSREGLSPRKPYATLLMAWLENSLQNGDLKEALPKAPSPIPGVEHIVVSSHDIDFYYINRFSTLVRLVKNLGISALIFRSRPFFTASLKLASDALAGKRVGDYLPAMLDALEQCGFHSTLFVVARRGHPRDPNYRLAQLAPHLSEASRRGFEVQLHSSYRSVVDDSTVSTEALMFKKVTGQKPRGNRQHWLRFDSHEKLFDAIEKAELVFDSTLGFSETIGFRNGASFAFPPYDFKRERPCSFLEIPLALMDVNLESLSRSLHEDPQDLADEILGESRRWGWGGVSILWHNPMEPVQVSEETNRVFWTSAKKQRQFAEKWMSAEQFLAQCLSRYQNAGLLEGVPIDA